MRAELEALAQDIQKSLNLLKLHLNWDEALRRLDELNALSEDPNLWNDAANAQKFRAAGPWSGKLPICWN